MDGVFFIRMSFVVFMLVTTQLLMFEEHELSVTWRIKGPRFIQIELAILGQFINTWAL